MDYPLLGTFFLSSSVSLARVTPLFLAVTCQGFVLLNIFDTTIKYGKGSMVSYAATKKIAERVPVREVQSDLREYDINSMIV